MFNNSVDASALALTLSLPIRKGELSVLTGPAPGDPGQLTVWLTQTN